MIEFRCVITVRTPAVWLARENIKRLTPRPCINREYSHGVVYMEYTRQHRVDNIEVEDVGLPLDQQSYIYTKLLLPNDSPGIDVSE